MKNKLLIGKILLTIILTFTLMSIANAQIYGEMNWLTAIGSSDIGYDMVYSTYVDSSGIYIMGSTDQAALFGGGYDHSYGTVNPAVSNIFITKLDSTGQTKLWTTILASTGAQSPVKIYIDSAHNVYVTGYTDSTGFSGGTDNLYGTRGSDDTFVTKLDSTGVKQWTTIIASVAGKRDQPWAGVVVDGSGNIFVAGMTDATTGFSGGTTHSYGTLTWGGMYIVKLNNNGVKQWATVAGDNGEGSSQAFGITMDGAGNIFVSGTSNDNPSSDNIGSFAGGVDNNYGTVGGTDAVIMKLDSTGAKLWTTAIGSALLGNFDAASKISADAGFLYVAGYTSDSAHIGGAPDKTYGTSGGSTDGFVVKLDSTTGAKQWITVLASTTGSSIPENIFYGSDKYGNVKIYVSGYSGADFAGGPNTTYGTLSENTNFNPFIIGLDTNGDLKWNVMLGSGNDTYNDAAGLFEYQNKIYLAGYADPMSIFGGGPDTTIGATGGYDCFVGGLTEVGYWKIDSQSGYTFTLPNGTDVSSTGQASAVTIFVNNTTSGLVGELDINFSAAMDDITLPNIASASDVPGGKALMHNLEAYPSAVTGKWILVPKLEDSLGPYHCPNAEVLADITTSCDSVDLEPSFTEVSIDGQDYYKMENQGGGNQDGGGETVPEFSDYAMFAILVVIAGGFFAMRRKSAL